MKKLLHIKFILAYFLIGFVALLTVSLVGPAMIENQLEEEYSSSLYQEAYTIAQTRAAQYYEEENTKSSIYRNLVTVSSYQNSQIWLLQPDGIVLLDTSQELDTTPERRIKDFNPADRSGSYYRIGTFYDSFTDPVLTVIVPVTVDLSVKGYLAIHQPLSVLHNERDQLMNTIYIMFFILMGLFGFLIVVFTFMVYQPLKTIIQGADQFASGNLKHNIPLVRDDEMGYLALTLNYMSDELDKLGDYQKKFIANVSHDFRSPLTSIKGYAEAMLDGTIPVEMQEKYLNIIVFETARLNKLTKSLLTLNDMDDKGRMLDITSFDINAVTKNTAATFEGICREKKISIELLLTGKTLFVSADMGRIQQVLYNLIDNAIKFSPENSIITVETTLRHETVFISVKDTGCGIPKESLPKIFDRFYKIDPSRGKDRKGTGLGLAIVKEIINSHNQNINVISTEGVGTEFIFTLPLAK